MPCVGVARSNSRSKHLLDVATVLSSPAGRSGSLGAVFVAEVLATALSKAEATFLDDEALALVDFVSHGLGRGGREAIGLG